MATFARLAVLTMLWGGALLIGSANAGAQGVGPNIPLPTQRPVTSLQVMGARQIPWTVAIHPSANYVAIGSCQAVYIDLKDETGKDAPRQPTGWRVGMADFDWTATGVQGSAAVGVYDGASAWKVCACQAAVSGTTINITATYPARSLPEKSKVPGLAFRSYIELPVTPTHGTFNPPGCDDALKTTTVAISVPGGGPPTYSGGGAVGAGAAGGAVAGGAAAGGAAAGDAASGGAAHSGSAPVAGTPLKGGMSPGVPLAAPPTQGLLAPTGIVVAGTPSVAHVSWVASRGATSYSVRRWNQAAPACCQNSVSGLAANTWDDANFPLSGVYVYEVTANFANGQSRAAQTTFTRPEPANPAGFVATQTGPGAVTLSWQAVPGVSFYQLWGPGIANTGMSVSGTTQQVTGVPGGPQEWTVGSFYTPGPVSTVATSFSKTQLQVTQSVAAGPPPPSGIATPAAGTGAPPAGAPPSATSGRYRVVANGFRVLHASYDDMLSRDGQGDEVYGAFIMFHYNRQSPIMLDHDLVRTNVIGDIRGVQGRTKGGTYSAGGGFRAGDVFPTGDPSKQNGVQPTRDSFPFLIWQGTLTNAQDAVVILPSLWEYDGHSEGYDQWFQHELADAPHIWSDPGVQGALTAADLGLVMPPGMLMPQGGLAISAASGFEMLFTGPGIVSLLFTGTYDRPIGMTVGPGAPLLPRRAVVLTREVIEAALNKPPAPHASAPVMSSLLSAASLTAFNAPMPPGTIAIPLLDAPGNDLQGQYVLYLQVERIP